MNDWVHDNLEWMTVGVVLVALVIFGLVVYFDSKQLKLTLNKSEWSCTKEETKIITTLIPVGKILIPRTIPVTTCVVYARIK